ncbi:MAG TPA: hypothetical protein VND91_11740 [Candidatus Saccharimonadia bacterium]|nr:hypothetical protein [Candidatus Saccharimonadia bacterium]
MRWIGRIGGILGMALAWALGGFCVGAGIELASELAPDWQFGHWQDIWPNVLAIPGFVAGAVFGTVVAIAESGRALDQMTYVRFAIWGATAGIAVSALVIALSHHEVRDLPRWIKVAGGMLTSLGVVGGVGTLALARIARPWQRMLTRLASRE